MATKVRSNRDDWIGVSWRLLRDCYRIFGDFCAWLWTRLWRVNRGLVRSLMPGQHRSIHTIVTTCAVLLELVGLAVWMIAFIRSH